MSYWDLAGTIMRYTAKSLRNAPDIAVRRASNPVGGFAGEAGSQLACSMVEETAENAYDAAIGASSGVGESDLGGAPPEASGDISGTLDEAGNNDQFGSSNETGEDTGMSPGDIAPWQTNPPQE